MVRDKAGRKVKLRKVKGYPSLRVMERKGTLLGLGKHSRLSNPERKRKKK